MSLKYKLHLICCEQVFPQSHTTSQQLGRLTLILVLAAHHEARNVLQEEEWHLALAAQFDEVRRLCV
jgi:predicted amidohydrolase